MKTVIYAISLLLSVCSACAQTPEEWLKQKETKLKYIMQQTAALKAYASAINQGYTTAGKGLKNIFWCKAGDFTQHQAYFESYLWVNPAIKSYEKSLAIPKLYQEVLNRCISTLEVSHKSEWLTTSQKVYVQQVCEQLRKDGTDLLAQWRVITTDKESECTDAERLQQIDILYHELQDRYRFLQRFSNVVRLLLLNSREGKKELERLSALQGVK